MKNKRFILPNILTLANIFCGYLAIITIVDGKLIMGAWLIILAAFFDALDGKVARITRSFSHFGLELDSIADIVSFGVAPSFLMYEIYFQDFGLWGVVLSFIPLFCGAFRLARFNIQTSLENGNRKEGYNGLPIPFYAVVISSYIIFNYDIWEELRFSPSLTMLTIFLSLLMISNVQFESFPRIHFSESVTENLMSVFLLAILVGIVLFPAKVLFPVAFLEVLLRFVLWITQHFRGEEEDEEVTYTS